MVSFDGLPAYQYAFFLAAMPLLFINSFINTH